jgi:Domain of unknown function (DUF4388)/PilZ domain
MWPKQSLDERAPGTVQRAIVRRQATRYPLVHPVELFVASVRHAATLEDLSRTGMLLRVATPLPIGIGVRLAMEGGRLQTRGTIVRTVANAHRTGVGVALRDPCEPADELFGLGVEHLMRRAVTDRHAPGLQGELSEIGLPTVLTMLEHERKTCRLVVTSADAVIWIDLVAGRIVDAGTSAGSVDAWTTIMTALDLSEGRFELVRAEPVATNVGLLPITHLLLEHACRRDESYPRRAIA